MRVVIALGGNAFLRRREPAAADKQVARRRVRPRVLAALGVGETGKVGALRLGGLARRRLLDLGFTPGAEVECVLASPFGETKAYRVRGTLIALRPEQARRIELEREAASA